MGIYLRQSVTVGPFRLNFSKSGIGVSAGVKGLRVGAGPRGNYVQIGRGALRYRASLPLGGPTPAASQPERLLSIPPESQGTLQEIESGDVLTMTDSDSADLLAELNAKQRTLPRWPLILLVTVLWCLAAAVAGSPFWLVLIFAGAGVILTRRWYRSDEIRRSVVLFYDLSPELEQLYQSLLEAATAMSTCSGVWHIEAEGRVLDRKYHAGASSVIRRRRTKVALVSPPRVRTNIATVALWVGRQVIYFFPDRVLVYGPGGVGAVSYRDLDAMVRPQRFIEDGAAPSDAVVVDHTWQYVNKKGGPDRRFKNNRQLPICLYEEISFTSPSGLNELVQLSRQGPGHDLENALRRLASALPMM